MHARNRVATWLSVTCAGCMVAFSISNLTVSPTTLSALRTIAQNLTVAQQTFRAAPQPANPADQSISDKLRDQINSNRVQKEALGQASAIVGVSIKGFTDIGKTLNNLRDLVLTAQKPGTSNDQLQALAAQFNQGLTSLKASISGAKFAGVDLLNGTNTQGFQANGLTQNDFRALNLQSGIVDSLTANSLQNALNRPDPFAQLTNQIVDAVRSRFDGTSDATARSFANDFINQIGRNNPTRVQQLGDQLVNALGGNTPADRQTSRLVGRTLDAIQDGASQTTVTNLVSGVINSLTNPIPGQGNGNGNDGHDGGNDGRFNGGDNPGQGNAFAFGRIGDVDRGRGHGRGHGHGHGGGGDDGGGGGGGDTGSPDFSTVLSAVDKAISTVTNGLGILNREAQSIKDQANSLNDLNNTLNSQIGSLVSTNITTSRAQVLALQVARDLGQQIIGITGERAKSIVSSLFTNGQSSGSNTSAFQTLTATASSAGNITSPSSPTNPFPNLLTVQPQTNLFDIQT